MAEKAHGKPWEEFEAKAAEAAAERAEEWGLSTEWGPPVRCVFLGPDGAGGAAGAAGDGNSAERPSVGFLEKVRFRWVVSIPDAPPGFAHEEEVTARANHVFDQRIPVPAAWNPVLKFRARILELLEKARRACAGYECNVQGVFRPPPVTPASTAPAPRTGETWIVREPGGMRVEVWVAAHHAADLFWCVKAIAGFTW